MVMVREEAATSKPGTEPALVKIANAGCARPGCTGDVLFNPDTGEVTCTYCTGYTSPGSRRGIVAALRQQQPPALCVRCKAAEVSRPGCSCRDCRIAAREICHARG